MKKLPLLFAATVLLAGCERDTNPLGPSLNDIYGDFAVMESFGVEKSNVDFSTGDINWFTGRFNKNVEWEIRIIGQHSGAEKIITGRSNVLNQETAVWNGTTTKLPMFRAEPCKAILSVPRENFADSLLLDVTGIKVNPGVLISDFESGINSGWNIFAQTGADMSFRIVNDPTVAPQGNSYYDMGGRVSWDFLIGLIEFPATAIGSTAYPLSSNPNNVFFNILLKKPEGITNEIVLIQFREDENGDGIYQNNEDLYSLELRNISPDWQLVSVRYEDLVTLVNGQLAAPAGNGIKEPHKLLNISVLFLADPSSGYSQTLMDYLIFTEGRPLEP
jgi:hypothetical protein